MQGIVSQFKKHVLNPINIHRPNQAFDVAYLNGKLAE
jgi:hypothetical protein